MAKVTLGQLKMAKAWDSCSRSGYIMFSAAAACPGAPVGPYVGLCGGIPVACNFLPAALRAAIKHHVLIILSSPSISSKPQFR